MKVYLRVDLPEELVREFLQAIRDFDMKHDPAHEGRVHTDMLGESDWPKEKMAAMMRSISPPPEFFYDRSLKEVQFQALLALADEVANHLFEKQDYARVRAMAREALNHRED